MKTGTTPSGDSSIPSSHAGIAHFSTKSSAPDILESFLSKNASGTPPQP
jgi:hypothetical protein